ncbi:16S rRNA (guanine(527)-N(7))-methyltransferase RsmG [Candidatus Thioglobus sp.]|nr:16S rRNA (guanine(527)-N(7))-methyltransferase RsmG [Candidatus Thioglobus sp.]MDB9938817.1 16S rRNA (guanine(527)-N(7))-methyltransferase RsmG [Candidatus Thioglobus sp.]MDC1289935.1 16S rRNA (guanine(527)-N(7))-methyltransferase RsmG [Candidatus Thioglobus sp.]
MNENERLLCEGAELMNVDLSEFQVQQLLRFHALIIKWNKVYNLSAIRDPLEAIKKHFLDSLSIVCFIKPGLLLDVGSGAGLPGIIIAIMMPKTSVFVIDSVGKKCRFMQTVKTELSLTNLTVVNSRVESFSYHESFPQITSRAFSDVASTIEKVKHLIADDGRYLMMKGDNIDEETIQKMKAKVHILKVPFVSDNRSLLEIQL